MKLPEHTNRRTVLRTIGASVVGGAGIASTPALAKKGGSGVTGGLYHAGEPFRLTFWDNQVDDLQSCMNGNSAETTYQPYFLTYVSVSDGPHGFLAMPENVAKNLDTSETYEFVSRTQCKAEGDEAFSRVSFRRSKQPR